MERSPSPPLGSELNILYHISTKKAIFHLLPKFTKNIVRFLDGVMIAGVFTICFKINLLTGLASILAFITIRNIYNKRRTGKKVCENCEYLGSNKTCVGYEKQKEALNLMLSSNQELKELIENMLETYKLSDKNLTINKIKNIFNSLLSLI